VGNFADDVEILDVGLIDLVHHVDALAVLTVAFDYIDKLVHVSVRSEVDVGIGEPVLSADGADDIFVQLGHLKAVCIGEIQSTLFLLLNCYFWRLFVQSNAKAFKLSLDDSFVSHGLHDVENNEDEVAGSGHSNNLLTPTLTVLSSLNNSRQVKKLDDCAFVLVNSRDASEGCELVVGSFRVLARQLSKQS